MACKTYRWKPELRGEVEAVTKASPSRAAAAKKLGVSVASYDHACRVYGIDALDMLGSDALPVVSAPPSPDLPIEDLVAHRKRQFSLRQKHEDFRRLIPVTVKSSQPIGILHFGDPHLDDDGTDVALVERHASLVRETPGLYGATVGDTTNNWVGRLAKLYGQQGTTAHDAWRLAEWFVGAVGKKWLYIVGGNHDLWSGAGDPLKWISGQIGALYQGSEARIALRFPGREVRVNCRHDFAGQSVWNPAHGPMKALTMGVRDHIAIAGHLHISAHSILRDPDSGVAMHAIRVASYKRFDRYALEKGLRDQALSPCALTVIDPRLPPTHPDLIKLWWEPEEGAEYLTWVRTRRMA